MNPPHFPEHTNLKHLANAADANHLLAPDGELFVEFWFVGRRAKSGAVRRATTYLNEAGAPETGLNALSDNSV